MKKKYLLNGKVYDEDIMTSYAQKSGLSLTQYLSESGATEYTGNGVDKNKYQLNGKNYDSATIDSYAKKSGLSFDEYVSEAGVKKKEAGTSLLGAAGSQTLSPNGTETTSIQPSDLAGEGAMAFDPRGVQPKAKPFTPVSTKPLILKPEEPEIAVNANGILFPISPNKVPAGYEKTVEGAKQYAQDISTSLLYSSINKDQDQFIETLNKVEKTSTLGKLNNNDATVSISDLAEINKLLGTQFSDVSPQVLESLYNKRNQLRLASRQVNPENPPDILKLINDKSTVDKYIKKVGNSFQDEKSAGGSVGVVAADLRSDLQGTFSDAKSLIKGDINSLNKNYSDRFNEESVNNALVTGIESKKFTDKAEYEKLKDRLQSGKTFSTAKVAELTNIGAKIIDARNLEKLEKDELDIDQYRAKTNELTKILDDNFYKKPDILQRQVAQVIAKHYERDADIVFGKWFVTDNEIDAVPQSEFVEAGIDFNRPEVKAAIKNIKKNEGILPFDNAISKDAFIREFGRGFIQPIKGTIDFIETIGASKNQLRVQKELEPLSDYEKQRGEYFNKHYGGIADAFLGAGQFISQYLMMEGAIGAFKGVGALAGGIEGAQVVKAAESAIPTAVRGGTKIGNYIIDKSQLWGQLAVPFLQSYPNYYKDALQKTNNSLAAKVGAFTNATMESLSEQIFSNVKFGREVISNFKNTSLNISRLAKMFDRGVFDAAAEKQFRQTMKDGLQSSIRAVVKGSKGLVEESFEEVPVQLSNFVVDAMLNPQSVKGRELMPELQDAFVSGLVSFSIPSILGVGGSLRQQVFNNKGTGEDALMLAARNRGDVLDAIHNQVEDGELDHDEANKKIQLLNIAQESLKEVPQTDRNNTPLSEENKVKYLSLIVQGKYLEEENSKIKDEPVIKINDDKIKEINLQKSEILTPKEEPKSNIVNEEVDDKIAGIEQRRKEDLGLSSTLIQGSNSIIGYNKRQAENIKADIQKVISGENKAEDLQLFENISEAMKFTGEDLTKDVYQEFDKLRKDYDIDSLLDKLSVVQKNILTEENNLKKLSESDSRVIEKANAELAELEKQKAESIPSVSGLKEGGKQTVGSEAKEKVFNQEQTDEYTKRGFELNDNGIWVHKGTQPTIKKLLNGWLGKVFAANGGTHAGSIEKEGSGVAGSIGNFNFKTGKQKFLDLVFGEGKTEGDYAQTLIHELGHQVFEKLTPEERAIIENNKELTQSAETHKKEREKGSDLKNTASDAEESFGDYAAAFIAKKIFGIEGGDYKSIPKEILPILEKNIKIPETEFSEQSLPKEQKADEKINQQGNETKQPQAAQFRTPAQANKIISDADQLTVSQRALPRDIPDIVDPDKKKTSVKDLKNRYNALQELIVNCLT